MKRGASIFILPIFILSLSVLSTFLEGSSLRSLYNRTQIANTLEYDPGQELIDRATDREEASDGRDGRGNDTREENAGGSSDNNTKDDSGDAGEQEGPVDADVSDNGDDNGDAVNNGNGEGEGNGSGNGGGDQGGGNGGDAGDNGDGGNSDNGEGEGNGSGNGGGDQGGRDNGIGAGAATVPVLELPEEVPVEDLAAKQTLFMLSRNGIRARYEMTLEKLEDARDSLSLKIDEMKEQGLDTAQADQALDDLDEAISETKSHISDSTLPDTIPALQRGLINYIINVREAFSVAYRALSTAFSFVQ